MPDTPAPHGTEPSPRAEPADTAEREAAARVPELLRLLDTGPPRKDRLVREIAAIGGADAWEGLVARLADESLRAAIEVALGRHAPPDVIDGLKADLLDAPEPRTRASVARILGLTADRRHGADVRALLDRETEPHVRHAAIGALGRFGDAPSAEALAAIAVRGGREARTASFALLELRDPDALERAAERWAELGAEARLALLRADTLADALPARATEALHDRDERVRHEAVELLARLGEDAVEPLLDHALRAASARETEQALDALAALATQRAAEAGLRALETLPQGRREPYRKAFLATLGR